MEKKIQTSAEPIVMRKRIGSTVYEVNAYFNPETKERLEDKILRMLKNDLTSRQNCATMKVPQTVRVALPVKTGERSSA